MGVKKIHRRAKTKKIRSRRACVHFQPLHQSFNTLLYPHPVSSCSIPSPFPRPCMVHTNWTRTQHTDAWRRLTDADCAPLPSSSLIHSRSFCSHSSCLSRSLSRVSFPRNHTPGCSTTVGTNDQLLPSTYMHA